MNNLRQPLHRPSSRIVIPPGQFHLGNPLHQSQNLRSPWILRKTFSPSSEVQVHFCGGLDPKLTEIC